MSAFFIMVKVVVHYQQAKAREERESFKGHPSLQTHQYLCSVSR
ncbi:hypothetical protein [Entomobacter blattae]|nr:hypothetical protein [Entomobacter blattae]